LHLRFDFFCVGFHHQNVLIKYFGLDYLNLDLSELIYARSLETQKGWINNTHTDADGIATFQIIQDNFPVEAEEGEKKGGKPENKTDATQTASTDKKPEQGEGHKGGEHGGKGKQGGSGGYEVREMANFLVTAEYTAPETGVLDGKPYQQTTYSTSMTGSYTANITVAQSKQWALLYASGGILTLGIGATMYRRRRIKPFKEVNFDER
jgi:hypothetical protein